MGENKTASQKKNMKMIKTKGKKERKYRTDETERRRDSNADDGELFCLPSLLLLSPFSFFFGKKKHTHTHTFPVLETQTEGGRSVHCV